MKPSRIEQQEEEISFSISAVAFVLVLMIACIAIYLNLPGLAK